MAEVMDLLTCTACPLHLKKNAVPGEGTLDDPRGIMYVGEAPGRRENERQRPFVGDAGDVVRPMIEETGLPAYICNLVRHQPPGNRVPKPAEIAACKVFLDEELGRFRGRVIVALGKTAAHRFAPTIKRIGDAANRPMPLPGGKVLVPTYHPAAVVRGTVAREVVEKGIQMAARIAKGEELLPSLTTNYRVWRGDILPLVDRVVAVDTESNKEGEPIGLSLSWAEGEAVWVPKSMVARFVEVVLRGYWRTKVVLFHNGAYDLAKLRRLGVPWPDKVEDTMVIASLQGRALGLKSLALSVLGVVMTTWEELVHSVGGDIEAVPEDSLVPYACADADMTRRTWFEIAPKDRTSHAMKG